MKIGIKNAIEYMKAPAEFLFIGKESDFEADIYENIEEICAALDLPPIVTAERQRLIRADGMQIKPDILIRHDDGTMTVLEVKKAPAKFPASGTMTQMAAVGQLLLYGNILEAIINAPVRLALIDTKIYYRTFCAFSGNRLPITLIEYQYNRLFVPYRGWR